jgi:hypothetical protein
MNMSRDPRPLEFKLKPLDTYPDDRTRTDQVNLYPESHRFFSLMEQPSVKFAPEFCRNRFISGQYPPYDYKPESLEHISTIDSIQSASVAMRAFHQNAFSETEGFAPTCIGLGASRLQH